MTERTTCRLTGGAMAKVFDLGNPCVSDFLTQGQEGTPAPLCVAVGNDWPYLPQLTHSYPPEAMYKRYHYRSGTNELMKRELLDIVQGASRRRPLGDGETWLDIACNDGTLLRYAFHETPYNTSKYVGVDPSDVALEAHELYKKRHYTLLNSFFSADSYLAHNEKAAIVTCVAMFYDLENPVDFLKQVRSVMKEDGLFVLQLQYAPMILRYNEFDAICHEHLTYWNMEQIGYAAAKGGFGMIDAELTSSNGGSLRVYMKPYPGNLEYNKTIEGMTAVMRGQGILANESRITAIGRSQWAGLQQHTCEMKSRTLDFLHKAKDENKTVVGYGASTKGNTLLQYFGITPELLPCIADRQVEKHGLITAGSGIPIVSEDEMRKMKPDYLFVLPWHFMTAFFEREKDLIARGTILVSPLHLP